MTCCALTSETVKARGITYGRLPIVKKSRRTPFRLVDYCTPRGLLGCMFRYLLLLHSKRSLRGRIRESLAFATPIVPFLSSLPWQLGCCFELWLSPPKNDKPDISHGNQRCRPVGSGFFGRYALDVFAIRHVLSAFQPITNEMTNSRE